MDDVHPDNDEQAALWNGPAGRGWIAARDVLDAMLHPFEQRVVTAVTTAAAGDVLDVGCGTGSTTLAIARRSGPAGRCVGIDVSEPMLAVARIRAQQEDTPVEFVCGDAQVHPFEPARFDMIVSRFGVMFFADPIAAFANLRRSARDRAQLWFVAWRSPAENPLMTTIERAAAPFLPPPPPRQPDAPGQFAFADRDRIERILASAGWSDIAVVPIDDRCRLPERDLLRFVTEVGPVGRCLQEADAATRADVIAAVHAAFAPHIRDGAIAFDAACWIASARAPRT